MMEAGDTTKPDPLTRYKNSRSGPQNSVQHETNERPSSASSACFCKLSRCGCEMSPTSCRAMYSPFAAAHPLINAMVKPRLSCVMTLILASRSAYCLSRFLVFSFEPSSTMINSSRGPSCERMLSTVSRNSGAPLYAPITTEISGASMINVSAFINGSANSRYYLADPFVGHSSSGQLAKHLFVEFLAIQRKNRFS